MKVARILWYRPQEHFLGKFKSIKQRNGQKKSKNVANLYWLSKYKWKCGSGWLCQGARTAAACVQTLIVTNDCWAASDNNSATSRPNNTCRQYFASPYSATPDTGNSAAKTNISGYDDMEDNVKSVCLNHGIMGRRFPDGGLLRYRKWVPQQLGDVIVVTNSPPIGLMRSQLTNHQEGIVLAVRAWS